MKQRDSFPPYDALGSEKNNSARKGDEDQKWIVKAKNHNAELDKFESKSDGGFHLDNIENSRAAEDENKFLSKDGTTKKGHRDTETNRQSHESRRNLIVAPTPDNEFRE